MGEIIRLQGPLACVVGARPNYMKMAPLVRAFAANGELPGVVLVHTGQHYDVAMNERLFADLELPAPDLNLEVGSGSHAIQTAEIMRRFDAVMDDLRPSCVIVVGDVNSTLACSLVASKRRTPVVHVEAGLRSYDRDMPEEINRVLTDQLADLLYTTERSAADNLRREGIPAERIRFVGNVMIDSLERHRRRAIAPRLTLQREGIPPDAVEAALGFGVVTLHRPSNVDEPDALHEALLILQDIAAELPLIWPVHPRTRTNIERFGFMPLLNDAGVILLQPQGYLEMLGLLAERAPGADRFRRNPGGDHGARRALPDDAREHRASDHGRAGDQHPGRSRSDPHRELRRRDHGESGQTGAPARAVGRPRRGADRRGPLRVACAARRHGRAQARMNLRDLPSTSIVNALTVDVEDYFQVSAFANHVDRNDWDTLPCRVERI